MTLQSIVEEVKRLSPAEQVELCEALAEIVAPLVDEEDDELSPEQRADLKMRLEEIRSGKAVLHPGDEVMDRLRRRA